MIAYAAAFLLGALTGAAGKYLADKYTDQRRHKETLKREAEAFQKMVAIMPDLLGEMKADISMAQHATWRDLYVIKQGYSLCFSGQFFIYKDDGKNCYLNKANLLQESGFLANLNTDPHKSPHFRLKEHFVETLLAWRP